MRKALLILAASVMTLAPMSASAAIRGAVVIGRPAPVITLGKLPDAPRPSQRIRRNNVLWNE